MCDSNLRVTCAICLICGCLAISTGCQTANHAQSGALVGSGLGGAMGAIIGSQTGHGAGGAVLGAMTGAVVGGLAGEAEDAREQRDAAIAQAQYERQQAAQHAITNYDLISMTQSGVSDRVIINAVETRGGQFDLSPSAIIELKSRGVSDDVILSLQKSSSGQSTRIAPSSYSASPTYVTLPPTVYVAPPRPSFGIVIGRGYRGHYHRHHGHWHHW